MKKKICFLLIGICATLFAFPILATIGLAFWDGTISLDAWKDLLFDCFPFYPMIWNSVFYSVVITVFHIVLVVPCAFGMITAKTRWKEADILCLSDSYDDAPAGDDPAELHRTERSGSFKYQSVYHTADDLFRIWRCGDASVYAETGYRTDRGGKDGDVFCLADTFLYCSSEYEDLHLCSGIIYFCGKL